jgi:hypothetical protein
MHYLTKSLCRTRRACTHFDNDLAEGSTGQMLVSCSCFFEGVNLIDHRMNFMFVEEVIHAFEGSGRADSDAPNSGLPEDHAHEVEVSRLSLEKANLEYLAADPGRCDGLVEAVAANPRRGRNTPKSTPINLWLPFCRIGLKWTKSLVFTGL